MRIFVSNGELLIGMIAMICSVRLQLLTKNHRHSGFGQTLPDTGSKFSNIKCFNFGKAKCNVAIFSIGYSSSRVYSMLYHLQKEAFLFGATHFHV